MAIETDLPCPQFSTFEPFGKAGSPLGSEYAPLISLWDMLRFYAATFMSVILNLEMVRGILVTMETFFGQDLPKYNVDTEWDRLTRVLKDLEEEIGKLPLPTSIKQQIVRARSRALTKDAYNVRVMKTILEELEHNVADEMAEQLFFVVPARLKWFYLTPETLLGKDCEATFPEVVKDTHDGLRCYVVDQWTASVFHFMRVLEHGLKWLCKRVQLKKPDIDLENWKNILRSNRKEN